MDVRLGAHHGLLLRRAPLPEGAPCPDPCCRSVSMASFGLLDKLRITGARSHWNQVWPSTGLWGPRWTEFPRGTLTEAPWWE